MKVRQSSPGAASRSSLFFFGPRTMDTSFHSYVSLYACVDITQLYAGENNTIAYLCSTDGFIFEDCTPKWMHTIYFSSSDGSDC